MTALAAPQIAHEIGLNIARRRVRVGYSQEELGVRAGLHRTAVSQLERGERVPRADTIIRLAASLGVAPGDLLAGVSWEPIKFSAGGYSFSGSRP